MNEKARKKQNKQLLLLIDESIRGSVAAVLTDLEAQGQLPLIHSEVWRDPALQEEKFRQGLSKLKWGFHCATGPDGKPDSLAADIIDANKAWGAKREFWLRLGASAVAHDLGWGGFFGLPANMRATLQAELQKKNWRASSKLGWDAAHVETTRVTVAEAKAGKR